jgi:hypothetical protein
LRSLMLRSLYSLVICSVLVGCAPAGPRGPHPAFVVGRGVYVNSIAVSSMPPLAPSNAMRAQLAPKPNLGSHEGSVPPINLAGAGG